MDKMCEVCGDEATVYVGDMVSHDNYILGYKEFKADGAHYFCVKHQREGKVRDGEPIFEKAGES